MLKGSTNIRSPEKLHDILLIICLTHLCGTLPVVYKVSYFCIFFQKRMTI